MNAIQDVYASFTSFHRGSPLAVRSIFHILLIIFYTQLNERRGSTVTLAITGVIVGAFEVLTRNNTQLCTR